MGGVFLETWPLTEPLIYELVVFLDMMSFM